MEDTVELNKSYFVESAVLLQAVLTMVAIAAQVFE